MSAPAFSAHLRVFLFAIITLAVCGKVYSQQQPVIGRTYRESRAAWDPSIQAPKGAPNVIYLVLDDVGFGQLGCYGSPIETPNIDALAANGLRYNNFHTTSLCSPSRASLLTGHNHHSNHFGLIAEFATGFPGYDGKLPRNHATVAEILKESGYSTLYVGKWHLAGYDEFSNVGPFERWPLGLGFERFYGFVGGETSQWFPHLAQDNQSIETPATPGYHLTEDLTDKAIKYIAEQKQVNPDKPFFLNLAYGAAHAPLHAPRRFIDMYRGRFDKGWDKVREETLARQKAMGIVPQNTVLPPRNPEIKAWDELKPEEKKLYARFQEVFAGYLTHCDENIGRLMGFLKEIGAFENTVFVIVSDNGASQEGRLTGSYNYVRYFNQVPENDQLTASYLDELGGPSTYPHYPMGWAMAGNTPFKMYKQNTHAGGNTDPLIIHWPKGIKDKGAIRSQYHHIIDVTPTILEIAGIKQPRQVNGVDQQPFDGQSMYYSIVEGTAPARRSLQYYEMLGHRGIYSKGWKALTLHKQGSSFDKDQWELYHVEEDFSESTDVAEKYPEKLRELIDLWWAEAGRYNVLPLDDRGTIRVLGQPVSNRPRFSTTFFPGLSTTPTANVPNFRNKTFSLTADVNIAASGAEGVLFSIGGRFGGFSFFIQQNKLHFVYNYFGEKRFTVTSSEMIPRGDLKLKLEFENTGENQGRASLYFNDRKVGEGEIPQTVPLTFGLSEGVTCGRDPATPVSDSYRSPFTFTGLLRKVVMDVKP